MKFSLLPKFESRYAADLVILPFWQGQRLAKPAALLGKWAEGTAGLIESGDFRGKEGETALVYFDKQKEKRALLLGLGKEEGLDAERLRTCYGAALRLAQKKGCDEINAALPTISQLRTLGVEECLKAVAEGMLLVNYRWTQRQILSEDSFTLVKRVTLIGALTKYQSILDEAVQVAEAVYLTRDLVNGNADQVTPHYLAEVATKIAKRFPAVTATIFDKKRIEKEKMGLLLAVGRGSANEPTFIVLSYKGNGGSKDHTVVVGKGVTFDTGGLNLKPTGSMETMRGDMAGAAAALGTIAAAAALRLKVNVTAVVPSAENAIDAKSFKPGDVYMSYLGKSVEIDNTDAEGRLILADALAYAAKELQPTRMIDFATLTGAIVIALGERVAGFMTNDEKLATQLTAAGAQSSELVWRLPLFAPYKETLKSEIADLKNTGGRPASSITAALFLQEFVENVPWAHLDIAGVAFAHKEQGTWPKNGVGFGVRLMIEFLKSLR